MTKSESLKYWERIREDRENRMVELRREADRLERERDQAHDTILKILNGQEG